MNQPETSTALPVKSPALNVAMLKAFAKDDTSIACVRSYLMAKAFAEAERERVAAYINPLFELYTFYVAPGKSGRRTGVGERITSVDRLFLTDLESKEYLDFMAECEKEHRKHGFTGKPGQCPALVAECLQTDAERLLIEHALAAVPFGFESWQLYGQKRAEFLRLVTSMVINENSREFTAAKLMRQPSALRHEG